MRGNCVHFEPLVLQIPADAHRCHYIQACVKVLRHLDGTLSLWRGPRRLARYQADGRLMQTEPLAHAA